MFNIYSESRYLASIPISRVWVNLHQVSYTVRTILVGRSHGYWYWLLILELIMILYQTILFFFYSISISFIWWVPTFWYLLKNKRKQTLWSTTSITEENACRRFTHRVLRVGILPQFCDNQKWIEECTDHGRGMGSANGRRQYIVTPHLIRWAHTQNDHGGVLKIPVIFVVNFNRMAKATHWPMLVRDSSCPQVIIWLYIATDCNVYFKNGRFFHNNCNGHVNF